MPAVGFARYLRLRSDICYAGERFPVDFTVKYSLPFISCEKATAVKQQKSFLLRGAVYLQFNETSVLM